MIFPDHTSDTQFGWFTHVHTLRKGWAYRRLIDGTVDDMSILGGHRGSYRITAGPLPADANPTDCQYDTRRNSTWKSWKTWKNPNFENEHIPTYSIILELNDGSFSIARFNLLVWVKPFRVRLKLWNSRSGALSAGALNVYKLKDLTAKWDMTIAQLASIIKAFHLRYWVLVWLVSCTHQLKSSWLYGSRAYGATATAPKEWSLHLNAANEPDMYHFVTMLRQAARMNIYEQAGDAMGWWCQWCLNQKHRKSRFSFSASLLVSRISDFFVYLEVKKLKEFKQKSVYAHNHRPYLDSQMYSSQSGHLEAPLGLGLWAQRPPGLRVLVLHI